MLDNQQSSFLLPDESMHTNINNSDGAEEYAFSENVTGLLSLVSTHVLRRHTFPLFVVTFLYAALYVIFKIVGDPVLRLVKVRRNTLLPQRQSFTSATAAQLLSLLSPLLLQCYG